MPSLLCDLNDEQATGKSNKTHTLKGYEKFFQMFWLHFILGFCEHES